ncbi:hypothetical protein ACKUB1_11315 [Methanospirillum stamsii]|uniref:hypothetical protein n=1 Tax=Methanospirillum stamsii TaxID=1277351 RepID=UPI0015E86D93|nr:hypothetical protein [Methanospirillum stamsii]
MNIHPEGSLFLPKGPLTHQYHRKGVIDIIFFSKKDKHPDKIGFRYIAEEQNL